MFLVCGDTLFDFFLDGENGPGEARFDARAGGSPFNVAIGLARLGGDVGLMAGLSTDMLGARLAAVLQKEGVRRDYLIKTNRNTTLSLVGLDANGSAAYSFYHSSDTGVSVDDLPRLGDDVTGIHFGSYTIAAEPVADAHAYLAANAGGRFVSLDPNIRPTVVPDMQVWQRRVAVLAGHADLIKISAEDIDILYPHTSHADLAKGWLQGGAGLVVVTDGDKTAHAWTSQGLTGSATPPKVKVIDTVGAGDTFQASLLSELTRMGNPRDVVHSLTQAQLDAMLTFAATAAAITCSRRGADLPTRAEVETKLKA
jgi:fructokinase